MMKWKIGVALVVWMLFLPMIANAMGLESISKEEVEAYIQRGCGMAGRGLTMTHPEGTVGERMVIEGDEEVKLYCAKKELDAYVSNDLIAITIMKEGLIVFQESAITDKSGDFKNDHFIPLESGYYELIIESDIGNKKYRYNSSFHVSKKPTHVDSDGDGWDDELERRAGTDPYNIDTNGDGIWDPKDHNPLVAPTPTPPTSIPAFQIILAIVALFVVAYLSRRRE
jgi:hypothetical protein